MSLDRVDDVSIVDKPREFRMSQQWQDQWLFFTGFHSSLERRVTPAFDFHDNTVSLNDAEQNIVIKQQDNFDAISKEGYKFENFYESSHPYIEMHVVRKAFLTFNRKANYEWLRDRAKAGVKDYKEATERLAEFSEHLDLPEISMPAFDESLVTPFVKETYEVVQEWLDERYDHVTKVVKKLPTKILVIEPRSQRMILGSSDGSTTVKHKTVEAYFCGDLLNKLSNICKTHDIESIYNRARAGVEGIKRTFEKEE